jgi:thiamine transporter ThiT
MADTSSRGSSKGLRNLVGTALLTAIVFVLQVLGSFVRFGPFSISLVLVPIVVGAALYGAYSGL